MATEAFTAVFAEPTELAGALTQRIARYFKVHVEDWCDVCRRSVGWEDRHFANSLSPEALNEHARLLDELERTGDFFQQAMQTGRLLRPGDGGTCNHDTSGLEGPPCAVAWQIEAPATGGNPARHLQ